MTRARSGWSPGSAWGEWPWRDRASIAKDSLGLECGVSLLGEFAFSGVGHLLGFEHAGVLVPGGWGVRHAGVMLSGIMAYSEFAALRGLAGICVTGVRVHVGLGSLGLDGLEFSSLGVNGVGLRLSRG